MSPRSRSVQDGLAHLVLLSLVAGVGTGFAVWIFKLAIRGVEWVSHGWLAPSWGEVGRHWVLLAPIAGGLLVGAILHLTKQPEEPKPAVTESMAAVLQESDFPEQQTPPQGVAAVVSLGAGAALGPEDPSVHIGSGVGEWMARRWGLAPEAVRALVAAGAAGGLGAAFHAPATAVLFAAEVFALWRSPRTLLLVACSALSAFVVIRLLDPRTEPRVPPHPLPGLEALALAVGIGVAAGVLSAGQIRLVHRVKDAMLAMGGVPRWAKPALGGLVLSTAALAYPELLGNGYHSLEKLVAGEHRPLEDTLALLTGKLALVAVSFGTGFVGGFFAPALYIGATLGTAFGILAERFLPGVVAVEPGVLAVLGMGAFLAGFVRAPLAATVLVVELSNGSGLVLPLLLSTGLAWAASRVLEQRSVYTYALDTPVEPPPDEPRRRPAVAPPP